tara:strand:- start:360 stop:1763 length:1404 start_codon:yes stop_codon:yes gene_type:complete
MGKGSKQEVKQTNTLDPEIKRRLFEAQDYTKSLTQRVKDGGTFRADRTDTFNKFLDEAKNQNITGTDFRDISEQLRNQPELTYEGPQLGNYADAKYGETSDFAKSNFAPTSNYNAARYAPTTNYGAANYGDISKADVANYEDTPTVTGGLGIEKMDPYEDKMIEYVIDGTLGRLGKEKKRSQVQSDLSAVAGGASGGSRHGIRDAELGERYADIQAELVPRLYSQAFNTAAGLGMQDADRALTGDTTTANYQADRLGRMFGAENAANTAYAADQNARTAALFGADEARARALFGAGETRAGAEFGEDARRAASLFGADEMRAGKEFDADELRELAKFRAGEEREQALFGAGETRAGAEFDAENRLNEINAAALYQQQIDQANLRNQGLTDASGVLSSGNVVDNRNTAMLGTAAGLDQEDAQMRAQEELDMARLELQASGILPTITNSTQTTTKTPGLFDFLSLAAGG